MERLEDTLSSGNVCFLRGLLHPESLTLIVYRCAEGTYHLLLVLASSGSHSPGLMWTPSVPPVLATWPIAAAYRKRAGGYILLTLTTLLWIAAVDTLWLMPLLAGAGVGLFRVVSCPPQRLRWNRRSLLLRRQIRRAPTWILASYGSAIALLLPVTVVYVYSWGMDRWAPPLSPEAAWGWSLAYLLGSTRFAIPLVIFWIWHRLPVALCAVGLAHQQRRFRAPWSLWAQARTRMRGRRLAQSAWIWAAYLASSTLTVHTHSWASWAHTTLLLAFWSLVLPALLLRALEPCRTSFAGAPSHSPKD